MKNQIIIGAQRVFLDVDSCYGQLPKELQQVQDSYKNRDWDVETALKYLDYIQTLADAVESGGEIAVALEELAADGDWMEHAPDIAGEVGGFLVENFENVATFLGMG